MYTVVCGVIVGTTDVCWKSVGKGVTAVSFTHHCTVGMGLPVDVQYNIAKPPTLVMYGDLFATRTTGQSKEIKKYLWSYSYIAIYMGI